MGYQDGVEVEIVLSNLRLARPLLSCIDSCKVLYERSGTARVFATGNAIRVSIYDLKRKCLLGLKETVSSTYSLADLRGCLLNLGVAAFVPVV